MGFSNFKTEIEVAKRFNLKTDSKPFVKTLPLKNIPDYKFEQIKENFKDPWHPSFVGLHFVPLGT